MKSQGTSKAGEIDWIKQFDERFVSYNNPEKPRVAEEAHRLKDFIRTAINQAIAQERERIVKSFYKWAESSQYVTGAWTTGNEYPDKKGDYWDYVNKNALDQLMDIITNNHE